jgi:integrase
VSYRRKGKGFVVEIYDPLTKSKKHVKPGDYGVETPKTERAAAKLERLALNARDEHPAGARDESCDSFAQRWASDYPRPSEGTNKHNAERVRLFGADFAGRPMRSITAEEARAWAALHPSRVREVRAMYNDAKRAGATDANPFACLGADKARGRHDIVVLTLDELDLLKATAIEIHGEEWGVEMTAMIDWAAYTCVRPGELFAAEYSRLDGDTYDLREQFNSLLRKRTQPKHNSTGVIYVPQPARRAVLDKPRRLGDDLIFRSKMGKEMRGGSLYWCWHPVRVAFTAKLPETHDLRRRLAADPTDWMDFYELRHFGASYMLNVLEIEPWVIAEQLRHKDGGRLVIKLYGHPDRKLAIDRIRRAFGGNVRQLREDSGDSRGTSSRRSA